MPKLIFRAAAIRFVDLRYDDKSKSTYAKLNMTAAFSKPVREAMEWSEPPAGFASAKLDGDFAASHLVLTPNGRELKQHEIQISAKEIGGFELHRVKNEGGDSTSNELRFQVITADPEAAGKIREYLANIGKGEAQLRVNYEVQSEIELHADGEGELEERMESAEMLEAEESDGGEPVEAGARRARNAKTAS